MRRWYAVCSSDEDAMYWPDMEKGTSLYLHKICVGPQVHSGNGYADAMIQYFIEKDAGKANPDVRLDVCAT